TRRVKKNMRRRGKTLQKKIAEWSRRACPGGNSILSKQTSLRRDEPGGDGSEGWRHLADKSCSHRHKPGGPLQRNLCMLGLVVAAPRFAAGPGHQRGKNADRHALADEADRAVAEESIYAAGVEAVDLAGAIHAVVRVRIGAAGI